MNPFKRKILLSPQTAIPPRYSVSVTSRSGLSLNLSDPRINRMALALMDMQAVLGGSASHWGGPSAFAEIVSALYGLVFHMAQSQNRAFFDLFHIINDAGHCENGLYALKANYGLGGLSFSALKGFRSLTSPLTGHGEAHLFPEGVYLSNGPLGSTLAQAQGLSMADKMQDLKRTTLVLMSDGACMEGEAKEAFGSIPGFCKKNKMNPFVVVVSDNNTKLSGRIDKDSFSLEPFFKSLELLGWQYVRLEKAHDLKACVDTLEEVLMSAPHSDKVPVFVHARTIKGRGLKATEEAEHGGHGFPFKDASSIGEVLKELSGKRKVPEEFLNWAEELTRQSKKNSEKNQKAPALKDLPKNLAEKEGQSLSPLDTKKALFQGDPAFWLEKSQQAKVQAGIGRALIYCREKKNWPVISISSDLQGSTGVLPFRKKFPEYSFDMGVAEANMISVATGFSKQGFIPVVDTFTQFAVTKGALPLFMANLSQAPVIGVFSHLGLTDAGDGASHQCLSYLAQTGALPMTDVYVLSSSEEAFSLMTEAVQSFASAYKAGKTPRTRIFFMGRETFPCSYLPEGYDYKLGRAQLIYSGGEGKTRALTLWAEGPLLKEALLAGHTLTKKGWKVLVVNASSINKPDMDILLSCLRETNFRLLSVEDHRLTGGMGAFVAQSLQLKGVKVDMRSLAVSADFGRSACKASHLYKKEGLLAPDIVKQVLSYWP